MIDRKLLAEHGVGVSVALPHIKHFTPTPNMTPAEVAYGRGREARRKGRPDNENPYTANEEQLSAQWAKGYGDTSK